MIDVQKLLGQFLGSQSHRPGGSGQQPARGGIEAQLGKLMGGPAGAAMSGALASGLARQLFKGKGVARMGGSAVKLGGAALVAGLAYKAWQSYQANQRSGARAAPLPGAGQGFAGDLPSPVGTPFLPHGHEDHRARLMLSAMIAAAKADGYIDAAEQEAIFGRLDELGLDAEEKGYLMDEMRRPLSIDDLANRISSPEEAAEVYTASVLAIDPDHPAERAYLDRLARRLAIDPALVAEIRRTTDAVAG